MRPIETETSNFNFGAPAGVADCDPMPCRLDQAKGCVVVVWEPSPEERSAIAAGQNIEVWIWQRQPPMTGLATTPATEVPVERRKCLQPGPAQS